MYRPAFNPSGDEGLIVATSNASNLGRFVWVWPTTTEVAQGSTKIATAKLLRSRMASWAKPSTLSRIIARTWLCRWAKFA